MERANLNDTSLEYESLGDGEPVVFIHGSFVADAFRPLLIEPAYFPGYTLITYHRRGYAGSSHPEGPLSITQQAADCRSLLSYLEIARAHVVGHSFGGAVALQLALDTPDLVQTLALLEPAVPVGESGQAYRESLANAIHRYKTHGAAVVMDEILKARWPEYRNPLDRAVPGAFDQAVADAPSIFESELPGLLDWNFGETEAQRIQQPVLSVIGSDSEALWIRFGETHKALCAWLTGAEAYTLPGATHFLQIENPKGTATALVDFFGRNRISAPSSRT